jgi:hypothetical protein
MTQAFLQTARSPEPHPPRTSPIPRAFSLYVSPSSRALLRVVPDSGPAADTGLTEALQAMDQVGQAIAVGQPTSPQPRSSVSPSKESSQTVSPRGPGIPFVTAKSADSGRNKEASPAASSSDEITPAVPGTPPLRWAKSPVPASRPYTPRDPTVRQIYETPEARTLQE